MRLVKYELHRIPAKEGFVNKKILINKISRGEKMKRLLIAIACLFFLGCAEPMTRKGLIETIKPDGCSVSFLQLGGDGNKMELSGYEFSLHWDF